MDSSDHQDRRSEGTVFLIERGGHLPPYVIMIFILHIFVMIGVVIPPVAVNVFVVRNITKVPFGEIYSGVYPFLIGMILCAALLFIFPHLITFLPSRFEIY